MQCSINPKKMNLNYGKPILIQTKKGGLNNMHQLRRDIQITPEKQKSKACLVQQSIGWTFDELVQKALQDPNIQASLQAKVNPNSYKIAMQSLKDEKVYTHPLYMNDRETNDFINSFQKDLNFYKAREEEIIRREQEERAKLEHEQYKQAVLNEIATEKQQSVSTGTI